MGLILVIILVPLYIRLTWDAMLKMNGVKLEKYLILASTYLLKKD